MHGILLVDKPEDMTSSHVVKILKHLVKPAKVGHTGTLDPAASGLLVLLIGAATRTLDYLDESKKRYKLTVRLGEQTDTDDRDGTVVRSEDPSAVTSDQIEQVLGAYTGVMDQVPPHYSAIKKNGVPLYKLARKGVLLPLEPRKVEIFSLEMGKWEPPFLDLELVCSKGAYARSLARDIGNDLGVGGRLERLRRTESGPFAVDDSMTVQDIDTGGVEIVSQNLISVPEALSHIPDLQISSPELRRILRGSPFTLARSRVPRSDLFCNRQSHLFKIVSGNGSVVILVRCEPKGTEVSVRPVRVFSTLGNG
jgi:tRNA pseudouridine55 synthase